MIENIEKAVLDYLSATLEVPVYLETPEKILGTYVLIEKTGGSTDNEIKTATIAVQSIAPTLYLAAELNYAVIDAMLAIIYADDIGDCKHNSDYNFTDTRTKQYRYQAVFNLVY